MLSSLHSPASEHPSCLGETVKADGRQVSTPYDASHFLSEVLWPSPYTTRRPSKNSFSVLISQSPVFWCGKSRGNLGRGTHKFLWGLVESEFSENIQKEMFHRWLCKSQSQEKHLERKWGGAGKEREKERERGREVQRLAHGCGLIGVEIHIYIERERETKSWRGQEQEDGSVYIFLYR